MASETKNLSRGRMCFFTLELHNNNNKKLVHISFEGTGKTEIRKAEFLAVRQSCKAIW